MLLSIRELPDKFNKFAQMFLGHPGQAANLIIYLHGLWNFVFETMFSA